MNSNPQKAHYERIHDDYEAHYYDNTSIEYRRRFVFQRLFADADLAGMRVADLACGSGHNSMIMRELWPTVQVEGFDISERACEAFSANLGRPAHCLDLSVDAELAGDFDAAIIIGGLHHCANDLGATLRNVARLLKPGGAFYFYEPNAGFVLQGVRDLWYRLDRYFDHTTERALTHPELERSGSDLFQPQARLYMGGPAYFMILNSLLFRLPVRMKSRLARPLFAMEKAWDGLFGGAAANLAYPVVAGRWRRTETSLRPAARGLSTLNQL